MNRPVLLFFILAFYQLTACGTGDVTEPSGPGQPPARSAKDSYYPLAVGNQWTYSCAVEGEHAFDKSVAIVFVETTPDGRLFHSELRVGTDQEPLLSYLFVDDGGNVSSTFEKSREDSELVMTANPSVGESVSEYTVTAIEQIITPATGDVEALRIENFIFEDQNLDEEKRADWEGRFFAHGIGLVIEADGIGGECVLTKVHLADP